MDETVTEKQRTFTLLIHACIHFYIFACINIPQDDAGPSSKYSQAGPPSNKEVNTDMVLSEKEKIENAAQDAPNKMDEAMEEMEKEDGDEDAHNEVSVILH